MDAAPLPVRSIVEAATKIRAGQLSASELLAACSSRIHALEPEIRAWVCLDETAACERAHWLDQQAAAGRWVGPLHGIPIGVKDIIDVAGLPTLAGSVLRAGYVAQADATVVAKLRAAGAILLGKTVTTEFACFSPPPTRNPHDLSRTPGGSSSGSAAAVATHMCLGALGTQTGGSIIRPASYCGVAGCKPTFGRVSRAGVVPVSEHLDHVGPLAGSAADLGVLLQVIAGYDDADPMSRAAAGEDSRPASETGPPRLGILRDYFFANASPDVLRVFLAACDALQSAGAGLIEAPLPPSFAEVHRHHRRIMAYEAAQAHRKTFPAQRNQYSENMRAFLEEGWATPAADYAASLAHQRFFQQHVAESFAGCDLLLTPATTTTAPGLETTGDPKFNAPWSYAGTPAVSIPCGVAADGLPVALQFVGRRFEDERLLRLAGWCEQRIQASQPDWRDAVRSRRGI